MFFLGKTLTLLLFLGGSGFGRTSPSHIPNAIQNARGAVPLAVDIDTVWAIIPADNVTTYCIDPAVIDFQGVLTANAFCDPGNPATVLASDLQNLCLSLTPAPGFVGASPDLICTVHCFDNSTTLCDTTWIRLIVAPNSCEDLLAEDTLIVLTTTDTTSVCVPIHPIQASQYSMTLDGDPILTIEGCDFDSVFVYAYGLLPGGGFNGPYQLIEWSVNNQSYNGFFNSVSELVTFMNFVDPAGQWQLNLLSSIIFGGNLISDYGGLDIVHLPSGTNVLLSVNYSIFPNGFAVEVTGLETHYLIIFDPQSNCADTLIINPQFVPPLTDTLFLQVVSGRPSDTICLQTAELPGNLAATGFCQLPAHGQAPLVQDTCFYYQSFSGFSGWDCLCIVLCDDSDPAVCDTTLIMVEVIPAKDTLNIYLAASSPFADTCLGSEILQLDPPLTSAGFCTPPDPIVQVDFTDNCLHLQAADPLGGVAALCVVHCNDQFCDTTIVLVEVEPAIVCDDVFPEDTLALISVSDTALFCLPIPVTEIANYEVTVNSQPLSPDEFVPCGAPDGSLLLFGEPGPFTVTVTAPNGCADTVLVITTPYATTPDTLLFTSFVNEALNGICIETAELLGPLSILTYCSLPVNGAFAQVSDTCYAYVPNTNYTGTDQACIVICDDYIPVVCDTFVVVFQIVQKTDTLHLQAFEDVPSSIQCLDTTSLPGAFLAAQFCQPPSFGNLLFSGNCFIFNPTPGFIGRDTACVFICDNTGICDTTWLFIQVDSLCSLFEIFPSDVFELMANSCSELTPVCVNLPFSQFSEYGVLDNGAPLTSGIGPCAGGNTSVTLDTGFHEVIFVHLITGCTDTLFANITCQYDSASCGVNALSPLVFDLPDCDSTARFCVDVAINELGFFATTLNGQFITAGWTACEPAAQQVGIDLSSGAHQLVFADSVKGCADTFLIQVNCPPPCPIWIPGDTLATGNSNCPGAPGELCFPLSAAILDEMVLSVNGIIWPGIFTPCNLKSIFSINYSSLPGQGQAGPYFLESWSVNGLTFSSTFDNAGELASLMSLWDPSGDWEVVVDPGTMTVTIQGGSVASIYSNLVIRQLLTGAKVSLGINTIFVPQGAAIMLPPGSYNIVLTDTVSGCTQAFTGLVTCVTTDVLTDEVLIGDVDTLCVDLSELPGTPVSVSNSCPGSGGQVVSFAIAGNCIYYLGLEEGDDSACIVVCDNLGVCDTTLLFVNAIEDPLIFLPPVAVPDAVVTGQGQPVAVQVLQNDTGKGLSPVTIVNPPNHGEVFVLPDQHINYVPDEGYCSDTTPDSFTYAICNPGGCDTAVVMVLVKCSDIVIFDGFSPNEDGVNDHFTIYGLSNYPGHLLRIYNRWGNLVFEAVNYQNNWDGRYRSLHLPDGTYFYVLDLNDGEKPRSGFVQLHR